MSRQLRDNYTKQELRDYNDLYESPNIEGDTFDQELADNLAKDQTFFEFIKSMKINYTRYEFKERGNLAGYRQASLTFYNAEGLRVFESCGLYQRILEEFNEMEKNK